MSDVVPKHLVGVITNDQCSLLMATYAIKERGDVRPGPLTEMVRADYQHILDRVRGNRSADQPITWDMMKLLHEAVLERAKEVLR